MSARISSFADLDGRTIFDAGLDAAYIVDAEGSILDANRAAITRYGYSLKEFRNMSIADLAAPDLRGEVAGKLGTLLKTGEIFEWRHRRKDGSELPVEVYSHPILHNDKPAVLASARDISLRKRTEILLHGQNRVLEMIASGIALPETLAALVRLIEEQSPGMLGSVLLLDDDGVHVRHGAAPNLPTEFVAAVDGQPIGPVAGSCGTAAYRREPVFVEDIATDPLWVPYKAAALPHELHASWSTPIFDAQQRVLGTFAMYYRQPGLPKPEHLRLIEAATHIAAIAIGHYKAAQDLRESEDKLRLFIHYSPSAIAMFDRNMRYIAYSKRWLADYNLGEQELVGRSHYEVFPDLPEQWKEVHRRSMNGAIEKCDEDVFARADGEVDWVHWETHPWRTGDGTIGGIIIFTEIITQRKLAEARVLRLTQLYAALSQCNQAVVRCTSEAELLAQICRDAVKLGGMKMAWIGMVDEASHQVRPVASFGDGIEFLDGIEISMEADKPTGQGPTGTAIRENRPVWCQDFQRDPTLAAWHERAARFGWGASASIPLYRKGVIIGSFILYAGEAYAFDESARDLLVEMAMDISFALDRFVDEKERIQAEEALRSSEQYLRTIVETEPECVKVLGKDGRLLEMNAAGLAMLEVDTLEQAREHRLLDFILPAYQDAFRDLHQRVMSGHSDILEFEMVGSKGARRWLETHAAPMRDAHGVITTLLGITRDVTERKHSEARIQYLANFDALTGLPNRAQLDDHLKYALSLARRSNGRLAVMFIDIDRFKDINDTLGHRFGDAILIEVARRLKQVIREEDSASRLGGDEFILMLPGIDARGAAQVAQKLLRAIAMPCHVEQYDLVITASIGIALYPGDGADMESLTRSADTAMYRAKLDGRNGYCYFTTEMQQRATRHLQLVNALRHALERDQFELHYQPQVNIAEGRMIGAEALLRWRHPELGDVSPGEFIPVAEDSGLILPIGEWVLRTAVRQLKRWMDSGHPPIVVAVNLSAVQFRHPSLPEMVSRILDEGQVSPRYLELELTEGVAMHDPLGAIAVMQNLFERGIRMSIDDFGTGYSSLNYLKKFKAYKLKIDQTFVRDITTDQEDKAIVAAIISMAGNLGVHTIAEGVETAEQLDFLHQQGCEEAQGYYYSRPLPADQFEKFFGARPDTPQ